MLSIQLLAIRGQKCSATSLLVLEKEVYEDENFKKTLIDATLSLSVGDPFDFKNKIGALADKPNEKVIKAIDELKSYENYEIPVSFVNDNPYLMKPSIKYGTKKAISRTKLSFLRPFYP